MLGLDEEQLGEEQLRKFIHRQDILIRDNMPGKTKPRKHRIMSKPMKRMNYKKDAKEWLHYVG